MEIAFFINFMVLILWCDFNNAHFDMDEASSAKTGNDNQE